MKKHKGNGFINFILVLIVAFAVEAGTLHSMGIDIRELFFSSDENDSQYMVIDKKGIHVNSTKGAFVQTSGSSGQIKNR